MSALQSLKRPTKCLERKGTVSLYGLGEPLVLAGHYCFQVLRGAVEIAGITVGADQNMYRVSCPQPPYHSLVPVHALNAGPDLAPDHPQEWLTVVKIDTNWAPPNLGLLAPPFKNLWPTSTTTVERQGVALMQYPPSWREFSLHLPREGGRVLLLGPKNSGKSVLAQFLVNSRIISGSRVMFLELDPGQCEFCAPGTLSLHSLTEVSLGPAWSHSSFDTVLKAHSLGYVSPMDTPQRYLEICEELMGAWALEGSRDLLVVNTPGWTKGLGLELNATVAGLVNPTHVVHMGSDDFSSLQDLQKALDGVQVLDSAASASSIDPSEEIVRFSAAELRTLQTLAYFHSVDERHLTEWEPYEISLSDIHVTVLDSEGISPEDIFTCVEGTIVAVVLTEHRFDSGWLLGPDETAQLHRHSSCIGYAVVQSMTSEWIRLLTPVDPTQVAGSTCVLVRGRLALPLWSMWAPGTGVEGTPWLGYRSAGVGAAYTKFRRNIRR